MLVPRGDASALAAAVVALLDDPQRGRAMSLAARQHALTLAWPAVIRQLQAVYDTLA